MCVNDVCWRTEVLFGKIILIIIKNNKNEKRKSHILLLLMIVVTVNGKDLSKYEVHLLHQTYILQKDARQWHIFPPFQADWGRRVYKHKTKPIFTVVFV